MPDSPSADMEKMQEDIKDSLEKEGAQNISFQLENVAFGLKAIVAKFAWIESKDTDLIENNISAIQGVSSVKIEDYRRAFG